MPLASAKMHRMDNPLVPPMSVNK